MRSLIFTSPDSKTGYDRQKTIMQIAQFPTHLTHLNQSDCKKLSINLHNSVNNPGNNMQITKKISCKWYANKTGSKRNTERLEIISKASEK